MRAEQGSPDKMLTSAEFTDEDRRSFEEDLRDRQALFPRMWPRQSQTATLRRKRKVRVPHCKAMEGYAFFNVEHKQGGLTAIVFNTNHVRSMNTDTRPSLEPDLGDEIGC